MPLRRSRSAWTLATGLTLALGLFVACGGPVSIGLDDAGTADGGSIDAGERSDAGPADAGESEDAGRADAGDEDAGRSDAGEADAGRADAGEAEDAGDAEDAGRSDAGEEDAGEADAGRDAGLADAGSSDAGREDGGSLDAGELDAGEEEDAGADAGPECEWGGAPGSCETSADCSEMSGYTAKTANAGACSAGEICCIVTPSTSLNPPVPTGWKLMEQSQVTGAMTTWAVDILNAPLTYPMFATTEMTFGTLLVLARVEWHPPDFQNSIIHRGVTLYVQG